MKSYSDFHSALNSPVTITTLADLKMAHSIATNQEDALSRFEIIWVQEGECEMQVNGHALQLPPGSACFLIPGQSKNIPGPGTYSGYQISISEEYFRLATKGQTVAHQINFLEKPYCCVLDNHTSSILEFILSVIQRDCIEKQDVPREIILGWLKLLTAYFNRGETYHHREVSRNRAYEISRNFFSLLASHFACHKKVSYYASTLAVSPIHLNQVIKNVSGFPASHHIKQCIILEAKRQAIQREKSMKEISSSLGFEDVAHFSKFFKKNSGVNFTNYRKLELV